jgi:flagellar L-ring protein precursor FlgH
VKNPSPTRLQNKLVSLLLGSITFSCAAPHITPYVEKHRDYQTPAVEDKGAASASPGSLWRDGRSASMLFTDARALRENDLVVIKIEENANANRNANTDLARTSDMTLAIDGFLKRLAPSTHSLEASAGLTAQANSQFRGDGASGRTEHFVATVPSLVRKVLPNGNLFIEGHRVVLVNNEEQHFYISGVIRPIDIEQDNSIKSTQVADAEIEFTGRGDLSDNQKQGWFARHLSWLWPF